MCAVEGSSVELPCTYSYPSDEKVEHTFWYYVRPNEDPQDLSQEEEFTGRVEYVGDAEKNCTLRIRELRKSDSGEYRFRFSTSTERGKFSGKPGVIVNVTDLQVKVSPTPRSEGQTVTLGCSTICTLPNNPTYIWYKNRQPVTNKPTKHNKLYLELAEGEGGLQYSCALGGPEESTMSKHVTVGVAVCLALILITGALWMCKRNYSSATNLPQVKGSCTVCMSGVNTSNHDLHQSLLRGALAADLTEILQRHQRNTSD
ncbi:sialoadhesin-like [Electrophorus electricus]|uniref:sialoadhesin-like n=1 Tax=Electrophorus electricus TaxID=8005 RepID=UPI0015D08B17|nr:sialoadhesin-like [Electrophorus electricus]